MTDMTDNHTTETVNNEQYLNISLTLAHVKNTEVLADDKLTLYHRIPTFNDPENESF